MSPSRNTKKKNNKTSRATFMEISRDSATGLSAMQQRVIRQHACQHSFPHRYSANADAGVVTAGCADRGLPAVTSIVLRGDKIEDVGFTAKRVTICWPVEMPPRIPPAWLER